MENPASVGNCGYFDETQWIYTKMSNYVQIPKQYITYTVYMGRKLLSCCNLKMREVKNCVDILMIRIWLLGKI